MRNVARTLVRVSRNIRMSLSTSTGQASSKVDKREQILEKALCHVHELGWSEKALAQASVDIGLPPLSHTIVERGPAEIVELFMRKKSVTLSQANCHLL